MSHLIKTFTIVNYKIDNTFQKISTFHIDKVFTELNC